MKRISLQDKYPVVVVEIDKAGSRFAGASDIADFLRARIEATPKVAYIGTFDHFAHTRSFGGEIAEGMTAALNLVFCFGFALPNAQVLAVRPRSFGIADMGGRFVVSWMEAPMPAANQTMEAWVGELTAG